MSKYIERDMTIALLRERGLQAAELIGQGFSNGIFDAVRFLDERPDEDVAPVVHGYWKTSEEPCAKFQCSVCGGSCWYYDYQGDVAKSKFCPNCGAKMDKDCQ